MPVLPIGQYANVIRFTKHAAIEQVKQIERVSNKRLKELRVKVDKTKAPHGVPKGSDQINLYSLIVWINEVQKTDAEAVAQLVAVNASCHWRIDG